MRKVDLLILGAGIVGSFAASFARALHPSWKIAIVDARGAGTGATRYSAGVHLATGGSEAIRQLAARSAEIYAQLEQKGIAIPDDKLPACWVTSHATVDEICAQPIGFTFHSASDAEYDALYRAYPHVAITPEEAILFGGTARCYDPPNIARQLLRSVAGAELEIHEGTRIVNIRHDGSHTVFESSLGETFSAKRALICNGPWLAKTLGEHVAAKLGLRVKKVAAMHLSAPYDTCAEGCALFFPQDDAYIVPLKHRAQYMFSFASREWDCDPDASQISLSKQDYEVSEEILARRFGEWQPSICGGRVFCDTYASDRNPIACPHPEWTGVAIAGAGGGAGFRLSPAIAEQAISLLGQEISSC